jgi:hypothetical protein
MGRSLQDSHPREVDPQEELEAEEAFQEDPQLGEDPSDHQVEVHQEEEAPQVVELMEGAMGN